VSGNFRARGRAFAPPAWQRLTGARSTGKLPGAGVLRRLAGPALLLVLWEAATALSGVDPELLPGPRNVVLAARELIDAGELFPNLRVSLLRVAQGLAIGVTAGTLVALLAGLQRQAGEVLDSTVQVLKAIPVFALLPLFIIWTGIGEAPKIALIAVTAALPVYINVFSAIRDVDAELMDVARCLRLSRRARCRGTRRCGRNARPCPSPGCRPAPVRPDRRR
jgi:sulfonate transport system permease protein